MRSCIISIITAVFSVTWSSEIIIIYWFTAQEIFLIAINVEISFAAQYFVETVLYLIFQDSQMNRKLKEQHLFEIEIYCNVINSFSKVWVVFEQGYVQLIKSNAKDLQCKKRLVFGSSLLAVWRSRLLTSMRKTWFLLAAASSSWTSFRFMASGFSQRTFFWAFMKSTPTDRWWGWMFPMYTTSETHNQLYPTLYLTMSSFPAGKVLWHAHPGKS